MGEDLDVDAPVRGGAGLGQRLRGAALRAAQHDDLRRVDAARGECRRDRLGPEISEPAVEFQ